ncbi:histidine phosphatase superfamily [Syncephalis pseudoplumigaleata]|uniref:Histidine phosphatase superfamily n=1 Tax=Syncephalis pseudoplumigaleata TaxID=1712513 RepID=A0A4P9Z1C4_9FUNG|nr:histidine phosphatase superfamily [Syncephalis pseudoplumigaleata]|eukprot:RKP25190.1 histidine phosphatase superfamily [Syncephalis pseudoplumigaleata]
MARHGTRQPHRREIRQLDRLERMLRKHQHQSWPDWLRHWRNPYRLSKAGHLTAQGEHDLASLARRDVQRYGEWLGDSARVRHKHARYATYTVSQVMDSARAYGRVYSGRHFSDESIHAVPDLTKSKKARKRAFAPYEKQYMPDVLHALSSLLRFKVTACTDENAIFAQHAQWCRLLESSVDGDDAALDHGNSTEKAVSPLALMDFKEDMNKYYKYGDGLAINSKIAGSFLQSMLSEMEAAIDGRDDAGAHLRFGHTGTIILILTQLGVYTDKPAFNEDLQQ